MNVVYEIKNKLNNKVYIGSTTEPEKRFKRHMRELENNKHHNIVLQEDFNKYGSKSFDIKIVLRGKDIDVIRTHEEELINLDNRNYNIGLNSIGGDNLTSHPDKDDILKRRNETIKNNMASLSVYERKEKYGKQMEDNPNWKDGKTYCVCGNRKSSNASTCVECMDRKGENNPFYNRKHSDETKEKLRRANAGKLPINSIAVNVDGTIYPTATECARVLKISPATVFNRIKNPKFNKYKYV